jgi:ABC-type polysaccharide/polyol phosphate export permease
MKLLVLAYQNWALLKNLIKNDFRNRYLGNHLGIVWAFVHPLVMISVYWFVFIHGFKTAPVQNVPFVLWLLAGIVPWFLFNDAINSASNAIVSQSFLIKKMVFEVKLLPIIKIGSSLCVNLVFWGFLLIICILYGYYPNLLWLQLIYYLFCSVMLCLALGFLLSAIIPFIPDVEQVVAIFMQIMFWMTPILWNPDLLLGNLKLVYLLNPFAYIIMGVRDSLISHISIATHLNSTLYFWAITLFFYWLGNHTFNKLRYHFADVL